MSDIYAEFGVTNAVLSEPTEGYNAKMISSPVAVRDGDDLITSDESQEIQEEGAQNEEASPEETSAEQTGEQGEEQEEGNGDADPNQFEAVGDITTELQSITDQVAEGETAFQDMVADAATRGLEADAFQAIADEYNESGKLSEKSYEALAKVGYSKSFVDTYIRGQEAIAQSYANEIISYAGGEAKWNSLLGHLKATQPDALDSLTAAMESRDLKGIKSIINLAAASVTKTFGKPQERTMTTQAKPVKVEVSKGESFTSQGDMVKAINDPRYRHDSAYRAEVEAKIARSRF